MHIVRRLEDLIKKLDIHVLYIEFNFTMPYKLLLST